MNAKRKKVQDYILKVLKIIEPDETNVKRYVKKFENMSDADFDKWMKRIRDKEDVLIMYAPTNIAKIRIDNLLAAAKEINLKISHRLRLWDATTSSYYITPNEYIVLQVPIRRMAQFVDHKLSVPEGDKRVDLLTGQVMKPDKAGSLNQVEVQALYARGLQNTILELIKYRGGDVVAFAAYKQELEETGRTSIAGDSQSVVRSAVTLDVFYSGMHIESNAAGGI